jgi:hypothetical protein
VHEAPHLFGWKRNVVPPFALEITAGDFAFAAGHRRIAINLLVGTLNSGAAVSIAAASCDLPDRLLCHSPDRRRFLSALSNLRQVQKSTDEVAYE